MVKKFDEYVKPFSSDTGTSRTDGQTDRRIAISIPRVSMMTRDKGELEKFATQIRRHRPRWLALPLTLIGGHFSKKQIE